MFIDCHDAISYSTLLQPMKKDTTGTPMNKPFPPPFDQSTTAVVKRLPDFSPVPVGQWSLTNGARCPGKEHVFPLRRISPFTTSSSNRTKGSLQSALSESSMDSGCPLSPPVLASIHKIDELFLEHDQSLPSTGFFHNNNHIASCFFGANNDRSVGAEQNNAIAEEGNPSDLSREERIHNRAYTYSSGAPSFRKNTVHCPVGTSSDNASLKNSAGPNNRKSWSCSERDFFCKLRDELRADEVSLPRPESNSKALPTEFNLRSELFWTTQSIKHSLKWLFGQVNGVVSSCLSFQQLFCSNYFY